MPRTLYYSCIIIINLYIIITVHTHILLIFGSNSHILAMFAYYFLKGPPNIYQEGTLDWKPPSVSGILLHCI